MRAGKAGGEVGEAGVGADEDLGCAALDAGDHHARGGVGVGAGDALLESAHGCGFVGTGCDERSSSDGSAGYGRDGRRRRGRQFGEVGAQGFGASAHRELAAM